MSAEDQTPKRKSYGIEPKDFVRIWNSSQSSAEATRRLSELAGQPVPKEIVESRASYYRREQGVKLKKMKRQFRKKVDPEELNRVAEEALGQSGGPGKE